MKKNQVNEILINQTKRRNTVLALILIIISVSILSLTSFLIFTERNKVHYIKYNEYSDIEYKAFLKNNSFFNNQYLEDDKEYIASLIDYINAEFKYQLTLEEQNIEYKYSYRIEAEVNVKRKESGKSLYKTTETLLAPIEKTSVSKNININEKVKIDYNYYNDTIKDFVRVYSLSDIESTLKINMYINVIGSCEEFLENANKESVTSLIIPLTTKTVAIDISNNLINTQNNVMQCKKTYENNIIFAILGILFVILSFALIIITVKYELKTRTAENIYEKELKKILNNYSSYIQKLNNDFDFKEYQLLKIDTFTDMLEIRDTIRQPILMRENPEKNGAYFVIIGNTKVLYVYRLKVSDIKNEIRKAQKK